MKEQKSKLRVFLENLFFIFIGLYLIGFGSTLGLLYDKEPIKMAIIDSATWPAFWWDAGPYVVKGVYDSVREDIIWLLD